MRRTCAIIVFMAVVCLGVNAQDIYDRYNGSCQQGGAPATTNGIDSSQDVQISYPNCTVTVYVHGTITPATLFSDAAGTLPLANPFSATSKGVIGFYAANGRYDIQLSGGGITAPFTVPDVTLCFNCTGGGGSSCPAGLTPQIVPQASDAVCVANSVPQLDNGLTMAGALTYNGANGLNLPSDGVHAGSIQVGGNTTLPDLAANATGIIGPNVALFASYFLQFPSTPPASGQFLTFGVPVGSVIPITYTSGGSGSTITVNGGAPLASPTNFQNGTGTTVTNPSGNNVEVDLNATIAAGSCTSCNITYNNQGQVTVAANGGGGGGTSPGGATTQDQFNDGGAFGGKYNVTFTKTTGETDAANLGKEHIVTPVWNYSQLDVAGSIGNLSVAGASKTLTLACTASVPCVGIDTTNNVNAQYTVYIATVGTPEVAPVTGGTCSLYATANCTIIVTTTQVHAAGFTVGSSTGGIQEAYNDAAKSGAGIRVKLMPFTGDTSTYTVRSTVFIKTNKSVLDGYGSRVLCTTRDRCVALGTLLGGQLESIVQGIEFEPGINVDGVNISSVKANLGVYTVTTTAAHPFVNTDTIIFFYSTSAQTQESRVNPTFNSVHTGASCVNGTAGAGACTTTEFEYTIGASTTFASSAGFGWANISNTAVEDLNNHGRLQDIHVITGNTNRFSWGAVFGNDQAAVIDGFSIQSGTAIKCATSGFCGAGLYFRGDQGISPVAWVTNSQFSLGCAGNGIRYAAGNGLHVERTVAQGFSEYGTYYKGGLQPWTAGPNSYEESGACANYKYPQGGGLIRSQMGYFSGVPKLNIVDNTAIAGDFPSFPAQNVGAQQNNYYIVIKSGGAVASPALYVGKCLTTGVGNCTVYWPEPNLEMNGGAAVTYDLLQVTGTAVVPPYLGNAQSVVTGLTRGGNCTASTGICSYVDAQAGLSAYTMVTQSINTLFNFWPGAVVLSNASKLEMAGACGGGSFVTSTYESSISCATNSAVSGTSNGTFSPNFVQTATCGIGGQGGACLNERKAGTGGLKGLFGQIDFNAIPQGDLYTLSDSNYQKTLATPNRRPAADANDSAIGFDNAQGAASAIAQMAFRAPVAISNYIGTTFDGSSWLERQTATTKLFNTPSNIFLTPVSALAGSFGFGPFNLVTPATTNCLAGSGGNMTAVNGVFTYSGGVASWSSGSPAVAVCAAVTNANQSVQIKTVLIGAGDIGIVLRGSTTPGNLQHYEILLSNAAWGIYKSSAGGVRTALLTGTGSFPSGGHYLTAFVSGTTTTVITAYYDGAFLATVSDSSSPFTSGSPGIKGFTTGAAGSMVAIDQTYVAGADLSAGNVTVTGNLKSTAVAFATLDTCAAGVEGTMRAVNNSTTATWGATITGGGANHVLAYCDGTNWTVMAQ